MPPPTWFAYRAFGLRIASAVPLEPYLLPAGWPADADPDLVVGEGGDDEPRTDESAEVEWPGLARVHVRGGRRMWVEACGDASRRAVAELIAGPALGIALAQRSLVVLHASAVAVDGRAVAVAGQSGAGKSTIAAMLVAAGGRAFSDDIVPVTCARGPVEAVAGPTLAKLDVLPPPAVSRATPVGREAAGSKHLYAWRDAAAPGERAPLCRVLLVEDGEEVALRRLGGQAAVAALLRVAFGLNVGGPRRQAWHLEQAAALARRVPVSALARPRTIDGARRAVDLVVNGLDDG